MILTPIALDRLGTVLDRFAASLDPHAQRIFRRIADPAAARRAAGAEAEAHRKTALELAAFFGMAILPGSPKLDYAWSGRALRSETEAYLLLHEIAHFQIAPEERRRRIDFGLGPGPESGDRDAAKRDATVFGLDREAEEALASLLGVLWEVELGQPGLASFLDQNWLEGAGRPGAAAHFQDVLARIEALGLADAEGKPKFRLAVHDGLRSCLA